MACGGARRSVYRLTSCAVNVGFYYNRIFVRTVKQSNHNILWLLCFFCTILDFFLKYYVKNEDKKLEMVGN